MMEQQQLGVLQKLMAKSPKKGARKVSGVDAPDKTRNSGFGRRLLNQKKKVVDGDANTDDHFPCWRLLEEEEGTEGRHTD